MARPLIDIDKQDFEALLAIQCTLDEIVGFFNVRLGGCSKKTIQRWCKRTYGKTFDEIAEEKRAYGKISIRRAQFRHMESSASMAIFLGKVYLGQSESQGTDGNEETLAKLDSVLNGIEGTVI